MDANSTYSRDNASVPISTFVLGRFTDFNGVLLMLTIKLILVALLLPKNHRWKKSIYVAFVSAIQEIANIFFHGLNKKVEPTYISSRNYVSKLAYIFITQISAMRKVVVSAAKLIAVAWYDTYLQLITRTLSQFYLQLPRTEMP